MIIGLTGYKGSGKDTVGSILEDLFWFERKSFADKLRETTSDLFGMSMKYFTDTQLKEMVLEQFNMTPREMLIHVGESMRKINPTVWLDYVMHQIEASTPVDDFVITDVRHYNEAHAIEEAGGMIVRVVREGCVLGNDLPSTGLTDMDLQEIENNGSVKDLEETVKKFMMEYGRFVRCPYGD